MRDHDATPAQEHRPAGDGSAGGGNGWLSDLRQDLRFAMRSAARAPLFTLLALLTLAVGIGANAAVFGVVKSVLLDALPYDDSDRLVRVYGRLEDGSLERSSLSAGTITDFGQRQRSFARLAHFYPTVIEVTHIQEGVPGVLMAALVGPTFFQTVGVAPVAGRAFTEADAATGAPSVAMLSHETWVRQFGSDPGIVGRRIDISAEATEVIGILPRGFVSPIGEADVIFPLDISPVLADAERARGQHWLGLVGRLKPGIGIDQGQRELAGISADLAREHPGSEGFTVQTVSLRDSMVGDTRTPLIVLMASAALVLLITCANLAGALLSRTISRRKEFAVRVALGAGRGRLVRQLLTESMLLAAAGGLAGLVLAVLGLAFLRKLAHPALPPYAELSLDGGAVIATMLIALLTGIAFGVTPALSAGRQDPQTTLRDQTRGTSESVRSRRLRGVLVAGQIALCVSLLSGAGLLARSLWAMTSTPLGFDPDGVLTAKVQLPPSNYESLDSRIRFFEQYEERLRALPGVTGVASTSELPMPEMNRNGLEIQGVAWPTGSEQHFIAYSSVSDDYFRTMRIPLLRGRTFGPTERTNTTQAIVINEAMEKRYWPKGDALGARIHLGPHAEGAWAEVVGVVGDVRNDPALPRPDPMAFASRRQETYGSRVFVIRTGGDPLALVQPAEHALRELDPNLPLRDPAPLRAVLDEGLAGRRLPVLLMTAFGALALLLATVGVYAMFAAMAAAREQEFGVRVALGSPRRAIAALVLRQGGVWMAAGLAGGALGVVLVTRLLRDLLYGVPQFDPVAIGMAVVMLLACATAALLVPVRRATRVDPTSILR